MAGHRASPPAPCGGLESRRSGVYRCMQRRGDGRGSTGGGNAVSASDVYVKLREEIVSGSLAAGAPLVEGAVAARYGMSRTPVREALRRLQQDGLVERADRGMRVRTRSPEEILEIYEVRIVLEAEAARGAAERATRLDLMRIAGALDRMKAADPADAGAMAATNRAFHEALWSASHNGTLVD